MSNNNSIFSMNRRLKGSIIATVIEGLLSGCNFIVLYQVLEILFNGSTDFNNILLATFSALVIFVLRIVIYSASYTNSQIGGAEVSRKIRFALGDKMKKIPLGLFSKKRMGFYINGTTSEVSDFEQILTHKVADIIKYIVLVLMVDLSACFMYAPVGIGLFAVTLLLIPAILYSMHEVNIHGNRKNQARAENVSGITEYITGIQTLRAYGIAGVKNKAITEAMKAYSDISYNYEKKIIPIGSVYMVISWMALPVSILFSVLSWQRGEMKASMLILLIMFPLFVCKLNTTLFIQLTAYRNLTISKLNIRSILEEQEETAKDNRFDPENMEIVFDKVDFGYEKEEPVLKQASFTIPENSLTAIVGDSGSGKSTILNLIEKYYLPQGGYIRIGGCDIRNIPSEKVFSNLSAVDQDVFLFNDTVRNNIRYARPDAADKEIEEACKLANCDSFIRNMEYGYETEVGENGNRLSGGERQRLSVARAILKDSPIILLDEATASLDIENELLVKQAIANLLKANKTVIMIAHTLSIVKHADKILVLDGGRITEEGAHEELAERNGKYAAMWQASQRLK
ncbi:ABC transporter ATP-binding protein [Lacrimispora sp. 38-1]|uniref:ABC transporter ATP-binding protein n=1 Tax=Lacrimispora sp. 38-1 TaxID=3125778 RepID=UPI003CF3EAC1